jgi:hypothetical protein
MRSSYKQEFFNIFNKGFKYYIKGKWVRAKAEFCVLEKIKGTPDYPTRTLMNFMEKRGFQAPEDWKGFRVLTEK